MRRSLTVGLMLVLLAFPVTAQDLGGWEIVFASDDEMLLLLEAAELQANFRPLIHLHCKAGAEPRVFFRPFVEDVRMQFDDGELFVGRFGDISYGFAIEANGKLVEEERSTSRRPMRAFTESASLIERMLRHERLLVRFQQVNAAETQSLSYERNWFDLPGLATIFDALGNPCLPD